MAWTIPDKGEPQNNLQAICFQEYLDVLVDGLAGQNCVLSGGAVTAQGTPDMTVAVAKAAILSNGVLLPVTAGNVTIGTADATNPRLDLIVADSTGAKQCRAGTAAANPKPPNRSANDVVLAVVYVPATDTTISSDQINDLRVLISGGPTIIDRRTSAITFNTTAAAQTYYSIVLPAGLLSAGRALRLKLAGTMLMNSGTPTLALKVTLGGTTIYDSGASSSSFTADTDRRAWSLDLLLMAVSTASQKLAVGVLNSPYAAFTGATTGNGSQTGINYTAYAASAIDTDAADRTLTVQFTMSVSNAADEIVREFAALELL